MNKKEDNSIRQNVCLINTMLNNKLYVCFYNYFYKNSLSCKCFYYEVITNNKEGLQNE